MKKWLWGLISLVLALGVLGYAFRERLTLRLMRNVVARNMATNALDALPDGLHIALCGAGSPLPDPKRSGPCVAVIAGDQLYIVDSGTGSSRILSRMQIPQGEIDGVLLTHFHSDHIDGLGELLMQRWANGGNTAPTPVYGPPGVEQVVDGFNHAYAMDAVYRVAHHGNEVMPRAGAGARAHAFTPPEEGSAVTLVDQAGLRIVAFLVDHRPVLPAVGYRFDYAGRSVLVSGDTAKSANLQKFADGVDLLVHEALAPQLVEVLTEAADVAGRPRLAKITRDILDYHTTPVEVAEIARDTGAGHLLFYHVVPPLLLAPMEDIFLDGVEETYAGPVTLGRD
ncbi:MAG: MBL fold metallo-hydrolase, partial [Deltaproteobacteria bacterium]|nr:MBL fold metallo-hydrolase [Deltaproteobacteria bacterium]